MTRRTTVADVMCKGGTALVLMSMAACLTRSLNERYYGTAELRGTEMALLLALMPMFYLAVAHLAEHGRDYAEAVKDAARAAKAAVRTAVTAIAEYDYLGLLRKTGRALGAALVAMAKAVVVVAAGVAVAVVWIVRAVKAADLPGKARRVARFTARTARRAIAGVRAMDLPGKAVNAARGANKAVVECRVFVAGTYARLMEKSDNLAYKAKETTKSNCKEMKEQAARMAERGKKNLAVAKAKAAEITKAFKEKAGNVKLDAVMDLVRR